ncbi:MAG: hypothetical protein ACNS60_03185 [Candidatus Cyclobacteriaceae bacterium M2_1C_046]
MKQYSFYGFIAGQIIFVLLLEALFFYEALMNSFTQHIIIAIALFIVTSLTYFVSKKMVDPHYFIQTVIAGTTVKLVIYVGVIFALLYFMGPAQMSYLFYFFITYLLVTTTEIIYLVKTLRANQNNAV